jgi:hypothetical protein
MLHAAGADAVGLSDREGALAAYLSAVDRWMKQIESGMMT